MTLYEYVFCFEYGITILWIRSRAFEGRTGNVPYFYLITIIGENHKFRIANIGNSETAGVKRKFIRLLLALLYFFIGFI